MKSTYFFLAPGRKLEGELRLFSVLASPGVVVPVVDRPVGRATHVPERGDWIFLALRCKSDFQMHIISDRRSILPEDVIDAELEVVGDGEDPRVVVQLRRALVPRQLGARRHLGRQEAKLVPYRG